MQFTKNKIKLIIIFFTTLNLKMYILLAGYLFVTGFFLPEANCVFLNQTKNKIH